MGRFRSITHPFAARQHVLLHLLPLDLHVLSMPLAFNLSQNQTLHFKVSTAFAAFDQDSTHKRYNFRAVFDVENFIYVT